MTRLHWVRLSLAVVLLAALPALPAVAQGVKTGLMSEVVVGQPTRLDWQGAARDFGPGADKLPATYDSSKQKYLLFVPKSYSDTKAWPLVVFISPGDNPGGDAWRKTCLIHGALFCAPYQAGNG